jgi:hypothetical protein
MFEIPVAVQICLGATVAGKFEYCDFLAGIGDK